MEAAGDGAPLDFSGRSLLQDRGQLLLEAAGPSNPCCPPDPRNRPGSCCGFRRPQVPMPVPGRGCGVRGRARCPERGRPAPRDAGEGCLPHVTAACDKCPAGREPWGEVWSDPGRWWRPGGGRGRLRRRLSSAAAPRRGFATGHVRARRAAPSAAPPQPAGRGRARAPGPRRAWRGGGGGAKLAAGRAGSRRRSGKSTGGGQHPPRSILPRRRQARRPRALRPGRLPRRERGRARAARWGALGSARAPLCVSLPAAGSGVAGFARAPPGRRRDLVLAA